MRKFRRYISSVELTFAYNIADVLMSGLFSSRQAMMERGLDPYELAIVINPEFFKKVKAQIEKETNKIIVIQEGHVAEFYGHTIKEDENVLGALILTEPHMPYKDPERLHMENSK